VHDAWLLWPDGRRRPVSLTASNCRSMADTSVSDERCESKLCQVLSPARLPAPALYASTPNSLQASS